MTEEIVDTERIGSAANGLRTANNNINSAFHTLLSKMRQLESWRGAAGTAAQTAMHQIINYNETRSAVVQNYVNILERQVNPSYESVETTNTKLADQFK